MRRNLLHSGYKELNYEIREIVKIAEEVEKYQTEVFYENIGDPVAKGEKIPKWMKEIIMEELKKDEVYGYSPSKGLLSTREYLAKKNGNITAENIIFFNGLGEAINKTYGYLSFSARVLGPSPAYPTHSSAEATNSGTTHLTYNLNPLNNWEPDLEEIENKVKYNPNVAGILVINPDNPTGIVFSKETLKGIIKIAKDYKLFVIFDEIYGKLVYNEKDFVPLSEIIGDVPGISMKGISKELPWPGARCGWIEVYNQDKDENFKKYINSIYLSKMLEVCSTTLPQHVLPLIYEDKRFIKYTKERIEKYKSRAILAEEILGNLKEIFFVRPKGAFYLSVVFNFSFINKDYNPKIKNKELDLFIKESLKDQKRFDKKFCYYMLANTGVCSVPLSGFNTDHEGFRITLLEEDIKKFREILLLIKKSIVQYKID